LSVHAWSQPGIDTAFADGCAAYQTRRQLKNSEGLESTLN
jgi:hypothetical protein